MMSSPSACTTVPRRHIARILALSLNKNQSRYNPEVPRGFQEVKVPRLRDNGTGWW